MSVYNFPFNCGYNYPQNTCCNNSCGPIVEPCPTVSYITGIANATQIPANTSSQNNITTIIGYSIPTTNIGGIVISPNNGQFTIPINGRYIITIFIGFVESIMANGTPVSTSPATRQVYVYKISNSISAPTLLMEDSKNATYSVSSAVNTYISIATTADLTAGDRIFVAASQTNVNNITISTTTDGRFTITRLC